MGIKFSTYFLVCIFLFYGYAFAQSVAEASSLEHKILKDDSGVKNGKFIGKSYWATVSDDKVSNKKVIQSIMEISGNNDGTVVGKVLVPFVKIEHNQAKTPQMICTHCHRNLKDKPMVGLQIINAKLDDGNEYKGNIIDPTSGKNYTLKMWLGRNSYVLNVRGYIMFFFRTQYWYHIDTKIARQCQTWFQQQPYAKKSGDSQSHEILQKSQYAFFNDASDPTATTNELEKLCKSK